jgi:hypothetical protein
VGALHNLLPMVSLLDTCRGCCCCPLGEELRGIFPLVSFALVSSPSWPQAVGPGVPSWLIPFTPYWQWILVLSVGSSVLTSFLVWLPLGRGRNLLATGFFLSTLSAFFVIGLSSFFSSFSSSRIVVFSSYLSCTGYLLEYGPRVSRPRGRCFWGSVLVAVFMPSFLLVGVASLIVSALGEYGHHRAKCPTFLQL